MKRNALAAALVVLLAATACSADDSARQEAGFEQGVASGGVAAGSGVSSDAPVFNSDVAPGSGMGAGNDSIAGSGSSGSAGAGSTGVTGAGSTGATGAGSTGTAGTGATGTGSTGQSAADAGSSSSAAGGNASAQDIDAVVRRATNAYNSARTARGSFTQVIVNPQTGSRVTAEGNFMRKQPDRFAFNFTDPQGDRIVADGRYVWLYLPSTNPGQVLRSALTKSAAGSYDLGSLFFENTQERFSIADGGSEQVQGATARVLRLTPRGSAPFARATVWVDAESGNLLKFTVVDSMGLERTVTITSYSPNVTVPDSAFSFEPPAGVRVVDAESLGGGE